MDDIDLFLSGLDVSSDDSRFFERIFKEISRLSKGEKSKRVESILGEEYGELSRRLDRSKFQDSAAVRIVLRTRRLADVLIGEEGEIDENALQKSIDYLKDHQYVLGPDRQYDAPRHEHLLAVLESLKKENTLKQLLQHISKPESHPIIDRIIRSTLLLAADQPIRDAHVRRAALSAWMCYLRQNVGSCFATAPAIVVQQEQPEVFLKDIADLLSTGRLKRVVGGMEYVVPLSPSWGAGDLRKPIFIDSRDEKSLNELGDSPGLLIALEEASVIDPKKPLKEKVEQVKILVSAAIQKLIKKSDLLFSCITAEALLRDILLSYFHISEKDLADFQNKPKQMRHTSLIVTHPIAKSRHTSKYQACSHFFTAFESAKSGFKALADNALLKSWEFSVASFAETKPSFTRWNMYASLGFNLEDKGGIADCLYHVLKEKLDRVNGEVQELQTSYELAFNHLKYIEARVQSAASEKELQWLRVEYQAKKNEFRTLEEMRDRKHDKARRLSNLLNDLLEAYDELFPKYFQEVYDADMHEVTLGPYDDSPAGFRLLYKHGRANTSQWTLVFTPEEFVDSLSSFFLVSETELLGNPHFEGLQAEISEISTQLISHVKGNEFIESAFYRMAIAHKIRPYKNPLQHLDKIEKKPWAYTSGAGMQNLMSCYFRFDGQPTEEGRWVENEMELLVFFVDVMKQMPEKVSEEYLKRKDRGILAHSPTHAFTLRPSFPLFKSAVKSDIFSYTWVRDNLVRPAERFSEYLFLDEEMMKFLIQKLTPFVPLDFRPSFQEISKAVFGKKNSREFRQFLADAIEGEARLKKSGQVILDEDQIDSALYRFLPLFTPQEIKNRAEKIFEEIVIPESDRENLGKILEKISERWGSASFVTAEQLQDICKSALLLHFNETSTKQDYPLLINTQAQKLGYAWPAPILFADTNWVKENFAFLINPGTGKLDLWRIDYTGLEGIPMSSWRGWLNGSNRERTWAVFSKPFQYKLNI